MPATRPGGLAGVAEGQRTKAASAKDSLPQGMDDRNGIRSITMYAFTYHRPTTVRQAASLLAKQEDAKLLAGGHTLIPTMKLRLAGAEEPRRPVQGRGADRHRADGPLAHHRRDDPARRGRDLRGGARRTCRRSRSCAGLIGDPAVRHRGTIGGSVANNDPNADYPAACLGLGATIITNKRRIAADDFFKGLFDDRARGRRDHHQGAVPQSPRRRPTRSSSNPASRFALVGVFVSKRSSDIRVAVTGAGSNGVFRVTSFEEALKKRFGAKSLEGMTVPADGMNSDIHGSAEYRAHLVGVLARRAVAAAE